MATAEQHEHEKAALRLWEHPVVAEAREAVRAEWLEKEQPSPVMRDCFDWAFEEVMFSAAIWSSNQDPLHPKVTCITRLEHEVDGLRIPGTRWGIDNPDSIYRVIPISGDERYEIRGRVGAHRMTENYFTLWDDSMGTEGLLNGHDLVTEADGSFVVTVDADPAGGRPNHVQSTPKAHEFYIRDVMLDWGADDPNWLEIVRLGPPPSDGAAHRRRAGPAHRRVHAEVRRLQPRPLEGDDERAAQPVPPRPLGRHRAGRCATRCTSAATSSSTTTRRSSST